MEISSLSLQETEKERGNDLFLTVRFVCSYSNYRTDNADAPLSADYAVSGRRRLRQDDEVKKIAG